MPLHCYWGIGLCVCARENQPCSDQSLCFADRCNNRRAEEFLDAEREVDLAIIPLNVDPNALNAALAALAANQQLQQQQFQQQPDLLTALTNRFLAPPAMAPAIVPAVAPAIAPVAAVRVILDEEVKYSGSVAESFQEWRQAVNRKALANNGDTRRAAISSFFGQAITWQEEIGINIPLWADWIR